MPKAKTGKRLRNAVKQKPVSKSPLWKGPEVDGITQSLLGLFLQCRERFRVRVVEGLREADTFNHRIEYGQMWHRLAAGERDLDGYVQELCRRYPLQREQILHWAAVCRAQWPAYRKYWGKDTGVKEVLSEYVFDQPYALPSRRVVRLRGRIDGIGVSGRGSKKSLWLIERKTKGNVREGQLLKQLRFDLQTMFYLLLLRAANDLGIETAEAVGGVFYDVVRRPLSGGRYSIRQTRGETTTGFYRRLRNTIQSDTAYFFMRWRVDVTDEDITRFEREFLAPILEQLCDWWEWIAVEPNNPWRPSHGQSCHWRTPYGFYNALAEGASTDLDEYLATGSTVGLERTDSLFKELE